MIFPKTKKIGIALNWHKTKDGVFGLYKGYFFNVGDGSLLSNPQFKFVTATTDDLSEEQKSQIKKELHSNQRILKFSSYLIEKNSITIQFIENLTFTKITTIYSLFDFLVDLFKKLTISEQSKCHNCGTKNSIEYYDLNNTGVILCNLCFKQIEISYFEIERKRNSEEKNYITGFLGSVVFSTPGIILWALIAVYLEKLASGMPIIIAFLGLKGYDYFKGRHGTYTKYIIVLANIIAILLANVMTVISLLINEGLSIHQAIIEFQSNEAAMDIFNQNTIISFIIAFFAWIWLLFFIKDNKLIIKLADKLKK